jgi:hypothetical protein
MDDDIFVKQISADLLDNAQDGLKTLKNTKSSKSISDRFADPNSSKSKVIQIIQNT